MPFSLSIKKEPLALIKNLILAELTIGLFLLGLAAFTNYEKIYSQSIFAKLMRYDVSLVLLGLLLQLLITLIFFLRWHNQYYGRKLSILDLILAGENHHLELKQTFRWDSRQKMLNKDLERSVMKTIAGFLNSQGGKIVIGVADNKSVLGLTDDYQTLVKRDKDGFENHFNHILDSSLGLKFRQFVRVSFEKIGEKEVCLVDVAKSDSPAYFKANNAEEFYIRTGNTTTPLSLSDATDYIRLHWK